MPPLKLKANSLRLAPQYEQLLPRLHLAAMAEFANPARLIICAYPASFVKQGSSLTDRPWRSYWFGDSTANIVPPRGRHSAVIGNCKPLESRRAHLSLPARRCRCVMGPSPEFVGPAWASQALDNAFRLDGSIAAHLTRPVEDI
ncbi:hypothetical protein ARSEF4850_000746 [Beauveria asiatica]